MLSKLKTLTLGFRCEKEEVIILGANVILVVNGSRFGPWVGLMHMKKPSPHIGLRLESPLCRLSFAPMLELARLLPQYSSVSFSLHWCGCYTGFLFVEFILEVVLGCVFDWL